MSHPAPTDRAPRSAQPGEPGRRPMPALISLIALTLLTALVWWRVLDRGTTHHTATKTPCPTSTSALPRPTNISVTVLNSTSRAGLAKTAAAALTKAGFSIAGYANDTGHKTIPGVGEIRYGSDESQAATVLKFYFPGATEVTLSGPNSQGKLIVSLGAKFKAISTPAAVSSAMASAHISLAPQTVATSSANSGC